MPASTAFVIPVSFNRKFFFSVRFSFFSPAKSQEEKLNTSFG